MKETSIVCRLAFVALLSWIGCTPLRAQIITASVSTTNTISINEQLVYTIALNPTNSDIIVSNIISGPAAIATFGVSPLTSVAAIFTNSTIASAQLLANSGNVLLTVTVQPTGAAGTILSEVQAFVLASGAIVTTNFSNVVTNGSSVPPTNNTVADLAVSIVGPGLPVIANDFMPFRFTVTNLGPASASGVILDAGFSITESNMLHLVAPTNLITTASTNLLEFPLGTLASGAVSNLYVIVQPTNSGLLTVQAMVRSLTPESVTNNNVAITNIVITNYLSGEVLASNVTDMTPNFQTGLMEQTVRLTNVGTNNMASARLVIHGLTNWLYNATGTNNGEPFVYYPATLGSNQSADLHLEYFIPSLTPVTVSNSAFEVPPVSITPPPGTPFAITLQTNLPSGAVLVEFRSTLNRTYTVLYADNATFSNELAALSLIVAPADRVQWIDAGPPQTVSAPTNAASRFYRVLLNP